ncbi:MAG: hypothetical protein ACFFAS_21215, partial [Promethearchaeota archaeon]
MDYMYSEDYSEESIVKQFKKTKDKKSTKYLKYLNIWDTNPRYKDISTKISNMKGISLVILL